MKSTIVRNNKYSDSTYSSGSQIHEIVEFKSLNEFIEYIENTPENELFKNACYKSSKAIDSRGWYLTKSLDEAINFAKYGWNEGAKDLNTNFKIATKNATSDIVLKQVLDVAGYQAVVPLYLQGAPMNMINKKPQVIKQKIITINKVTSFSSGISSSQVIKETTKCLEIIKKIESKGFRVNLNLLISTGKVCVKIRLKSANERLNIAKLAFPVVHPSMFRRLFFRFVETYPSYNEMHFKNGYGFVPQEDDFNIACKKGEVMMSTVMRCEENGAFDWNQLSIENLLKNI